MHTHEGQPRSWYKTGLLDLLAKWTPTSSSSQKENPDYHHIQETICRENEERKADARAADGFLRPTGRRYAGRPDDDL